MLAITKRSKSERLSPIGSVRLLTLPPTYCNLPFITFHMENGDIAVRTHADI